MNANERENELDEIAKIVIGAAFEVCNTLGAGFMEKVYERALMREITLSSLRVQQQVGFPVFYKDHEVGHYAADLVVEGRLIVELKCVECFLNEHLAQCINYLRVSNLKLALLINFQKPKLEWRRLALGK